MSVFLIAHIKNPQRGTEKQYYIKNSHGDVVQLTDDSGEVIKTYEHDSFGLVYYEGKQYEMTEEYFEIVNRNSEGVVLGVKIASIKNFIRMR